MAKAPTKAKPKFMNYDHQFHAGNAADCCKHLALTLFLQALTRKDAPLAYIDTHAGAARYALAREGEYLEGIGRLWSDRRSLVHAATWLKTVAAANADGALRHYPGSPAVAAALLRPTDRMVLCEQEAEPAQALRAAMGRRAHTSILAENGYRALFAQIPPAERRGLVLLDPPFEARDEWERLTDTLLRAYKIWPQGAYLVWYPVKTRGIITRFLQGLRGKLPATVMELLQRPEEGRERLIGSGLLMVNPPWGVVDNLAAAFAEIGPLLADPAMGGRWSLRCEGWPKAPVPAQ